MAYKIQIGQVEGLRSAIADLYSTINATGTEFTDDLYAFETSFISLLESTGNYLYNLIDTVDNTQTSNLSLTGLSLQNQMNLLPDQTDFDALDAEITANYNSLYTTSGKIDSLSGVVSGHTNSINSLLTATGLLMPLYGVASSPATHEFYHIVDGSTTWSGLGAVTLFASSQFLIDANDNLNIECAGAISITGDTTLNINTLGDLTVNSDDITVSTDTLAISARQHLFKGTGNEAILTIDQGVDTFASFQVDSDYFLINVNQGDDPFLQIGTVTNIIAMDDSPASAGQGLSIQAASGIYLNAASIQMPIIPTSSAGLAAGTIWKSGNYLMIV